MKILRKKSRCSFRRADIGDSPQAKAGGGWFPDLPSAPGPITRDLPGQVAVPRFDGRTYSKQMAALSRPPAALSRIREVAVPEMCSVGVPTACTIRKLENQHPEELPPEC